LVGVFAGIEFDTAVDAFSGSGVVAYSLKAMGKAVTASDYLNFPATVARATVENPGLRLTSEEVAAVAGPNRDGRDFIRRTFHGLYFPDEDHEFLDAAWSNLDLLPIYKRDLAIAGLCLAAARKQPRGVFTITDFRYDDGRKNLRLPLRDIFVEAVQALNAAVFDNGRKNVALRENVASLDPRGYDLAYFDPPYAPPRDDNDYIKRYHFLEGLSCYWEGTEIMERTKTKKLAKRFTPYAYKHTIGPALVELFDRFRESTIVLSYSSNSVPDQHEIVALLRAVKPRVEVIAVPHRYSFGTHVAAVRRQVDEYIFVAR
jgi:DNA adenine methylase/adenine-specific DNA-methyltransferase